MATAEPVLAKRIKQSSSTKKRYLAVPVKRYSIDVWTPEHLLDVPVGHDFVWTPIDDFDSDVLIDGPFQSRRDAMAEAACSNTHFLKVGRTIWNVVLRIEEVSNSWFNGETEFGGGDVELKLYATYRASIVRFSAREAARFGKFAALKELLERADAARLA
jgi:hypothetical protein